VVTNKYFIRRVWTLCQAVLLLAFFLRRSQNSQRLPACGNRSFLYLRLPGSTKCMCGWAGIGWILTQGLAGCDKNCRI